MCGSSTVSKSTLHALNLFYVVVSFVLIGVAAYGKTSNMITSVPIVGGIIASGIFLLFIAIFGIYGTLKQSQVMLFLYMIILFFLFVLQFSISCACLAVTKDDQLKIAELAWNKTKETYPDTIFNAESFLNCCGFNSYNDGYNCDLIDACKPRPNSSQYTCPTCKEAIEEKIGKAFSASGTVGLLFSFTELIAIIYAYRFRKQCIYVA